MAQTSSKPTFEIKEIFEVSDKGWFVTAQIQGENKDFRVTSSSKLGEAELTEFLDIPRKVDGGGGQDYTHFIFHLKNEMQRSHIQPGDVVQLN